VFGLDEQLAGIGGGSGSVVVALVVALLLGLRHATDPDHLTALSTLVLADDERGVRRAGRLGLAWGLGHGTTLVIFGVPIVIAGAYLPELVQHGAELLVGLVIIALALRLLIRWRRGRFHAHPHSHDGVRHRHLHPHGHGPHHAHTHATESQLGRSPRQERTEKPVYCPVRFTAFPVMKAARRPQSSPERKRAAVASGPSPLLRYQEIRTCSERREGNGPNLPG